MRRTLFIFNYQKRLFGSGGRKAGLSNTDYMKNIQKQQKLKQLEKEEDKD